MYLLVDNYDSFTWNIYHYLSYFKIKVEVKRNDKINLKSFNKRKYDGIIFSPGPGKPEDAGEMMTIINTYKDQIPMLGICLGHQAISSCYGAKIIKMKKVMHGKTDKIKVIKKNNIVKGLPNEFIATRYHSLEVSKKLLPKSIQITAITKKNNIMAIKIKNRNIFGLQFHPESIATKNGKIFFKNFLDICNNIKSKNYDI